MQSITPSGGQELRKAMQKGRFPLVSIGIFSFFVNLLMLSGPLFMLQIYDRVLGSRSEETLVALLILVAGLFGFMGLLDFARIRIAARVGAGFQAALDARVFSATLAGPAAQTGHDDSTAALHNLESIQRLLSSSALFGLIDIPWVPIFILTIFAFHPLLGWLALGGTALLVVLAIANQIFSLQPLTRSSQQSMTSDALAEVLRQQNDVVRGLGMTRSALVRWQAQRNAALSSQIRAADLTAIFGTLSKSFRLFLQSAILALGAYLVLQNQVTAGAMIAASVMLGRALAPIEQTIGQWHVILMAVNGWKNLTGFLSRVPPRPKHTKLPRPKPFLQVDALSFVPSGARFPSLRMISFTLEPGLALGVVGPSASGKSALARIIAGVWPPTTGSVRLDGATLDQYGPDLGTHIGYLPQDVTLFEATIAENIARLSSAPDSAAVILAAKKAGAHEMILKLPQGYDTMINCVSRLSGGQKQRIGLARAMFGNPVLLVLDEPNANLDAQGSEALNRAIRNFKANGGAIIIMAHRPAGITECDLLLVLQDGVAQAFGPQHEVLQSQLKNYREVSKMLEPEGRA